MIVIDPYHPGSPPTPPSLSELALAAYRSLGAYGVMFACIILLLRRPAWEFSVVDMVFWANLIVLLVLRARAAKVSCTTRELARPRLSHFAVALLLWTGAQSMQLVD